MTESPRGRELSNQEIYLQSPRNHIYLPHSEYDCAPNLFAVIATPEKLTKPSSQTLGLVSPTDVPFTYNPVTTQITTSVGRALLTYSLTRGLNRLWITKPETPSQITASTSWAKYTIAAFGDPQKGEPQGLVVSKRGDETASIELPRDLDEPIREIVVFGSWIVAAAITRVEVWKSTTLEHYTTIQSFGAKGDNEITGGICTMPGYLNKLWVGRKNGWVELWNVQTGKLIHTFVPPSRDCGAVTCLEPTTSRSLLAISYAGGQLVIRDILNDIDILELFAGTPDAPVTNIAFRTDGRGAGEDGREDGVMATSTTASGDISFWDLTDGGRLSGILRSAHNPPTVRSGNVRGGVNKIQFLPGQNVIISSGLDNSLNTWIFDQTPFCPVPRILHQRTGHAGQINCLQWLQSDFDGHEAGKKWLLTGGQDRSLWGWSLRRDGQSSELSQGNIRKQAKKRGLLTANLSGQGPTTAVEDLKAPEITCIASSLNRDGGIGALPGKISQWQKGSHKSKESDAEASFTTGWDSVITGHKGDSYARTWFWGRRRAGRWAFQTGDKTDVSTVAISTCGTFALVGSEGGSIDMFNLQSGLQRQKFPSTLTPAQARQVKMQQLKQADTVSKLRSGATTPYPAGVGRHTKAITGLVISPVHAWVVSCSLDGKVRFWDFLTGNLLHQLSWGMGVTGCKFHAGTDLIAFSCQDDVIRLVDVGTKNIVRQFRGCQDKINDICWSHDGRWIVACSRDCTIRVWDLPTGNMVDGFRLEKPCSALAMAESNEYLAAAVEGEIGVNLWVNQAFFRKRTPTRHITEADIVTISGPGVTGSSRDVIPQLEAAEAAGDEDRDEDEDEAVAPLGVEEINSELMKLSLVPKSQWQTLLHLDEIKARNKPLEPPKQPEKAPFFLPSAGEKRVVPSAAGNTGGGNGTEPRITHFELNRNDPRSLVAVLRDGAQKGDYIPYITLLKSLSPSDADLEISSLSIHSTTSVPPNKQLDDLTLFLCALTQRRRQKRDFEMIEVWMRVFMRAHDAEIASNEQVGKAFREWYETSNESWKELDRMVAFATASFGFFMNPEA
ncbi:Utp21-domain-containing protein [Zalerion maritima]|uniref:Utp21-domain-containing protein n=1 Tax=Zalerion maritima TaxID=339359 RepID=A0AAD5WTA1_9PEZI|nr:Utp21-domain-containing protein [Zalerion maritima]